jgi:hypothetical protein
MQTQGMKAAAAHACRSPHSFPILLGVPASTVQNHSPRTSKSREYWHILATPDALLSTVM